MVTGGDPYPSALNLYASAVTSSLRKLGKQEPGRSAPYRLASTCRGGGGCSAENQQMGSRSPSPPPTPDLRSLWWDLSASPSPPPAHTAPLWAGSCFVPGGVPGAWHRVWHFGPRQTCLGMLTPPVNKPGELRMLHPDPVRMDQMRPIRHCSQRVPVVVAAKVRLMTVRDVR